MENGKVKLGKLEIDLGELAEFLVKAKKSCYAGNGQEERLRDGSKVLTFQDGDFHYTDNYAGFYQASGTEIVRWQKADGQRLWQMSYNGGLAPEFQGDEEVTKDVFVFLKEALAQTTPEKPFRGPEPKKVMRRGLLGFYEYETNTKGDLKKFSGQENIYLDDILKVYLIFSQNYIGGLVIPKD